MISIKRRELLFGLASATFVAGCTNSAGRNGAAKIDARVGATLAEMYSQFPGTNQLSQKARGVLVMPLMTEAGLGIGGAYGRGALRVGDVSVDYYSAAKASAGLQIGAQQYAHVLFFMTEDALMDFRHSPGWAAGADIEYALPAGGKTIAAETTTSLAPVIAMIFGHAGLRLGASLEGVKYTRITP
ncbi:MAG: YSC84-related protein [Pelagibaca sp.]